MFGITPYGVTPLAYEQLVPQSVLSVTTPTSSRTLGSGRKLASNLTSSNSRTLNTARSEPDPVNLVRNPTTSGAVVGTPGTDPTNWARQNVAGLTTSVSAVGTDNGIPYTEWHITGTPSASGSWALFFESLTFIPAMNGNLFKISAVLNRGTASAWTGVSSAAFFYQLFSVGPVFLTQVNYPSIAAAAFDNASLIIRPFGGVQTVAPSQPTLATVRPGLLFNVTSGTPVDVTLRVGQVLFATVSPGARIAAVLARLLSTAAVRIGTVSPITTIRDAIAKQFTAFMGVTQNTSRIAITRAVSAVANIGFIERAVRAINLPRINPVSMIGSRVETVSLLRSLIIAVSSNITAIKTMALNAVLNTIGQFNINTGAQRTATVNITAILGSFQIGKRLNVLITIIAMVRQGIVLTQQIVINVVGTIRNTTLIPLITMINSVASVIRDIAYNTTLRVLQETYRINTIFRFTNADANVTTRRTNTMVVSQLAMLLTSTTFSWFKFRPVNFVVDVWGRASYRLLPIKFIMANVLTLALLNTGITKTIRVYFTTIAKTLNNTLPAPFLAAIGTAGYLARSIGRGIYSIIPLVAYRRSVIGWSLVTEIGVSVYREAAISISRLAAAVAFLVSRTQAHLIRTYTVSSAEAPVLGMSIADEVEVVEMANTEELVVRLTVQEIAP